MPIRFRRRKTRRRRGGKKDWDFNNSIDNRVFGAGRTENCICPSCKAMSLHRPGFPCYRIKCPKCGQAMTRQFIVGN